MRGSEFEGGVGLREVKVTTSGGGSGASSVEADVYYSTVPYADLYAKVRTFGGHVKADGTVEGMNTDAVEKLIDGTTLYEQPDQTSIPYLHKLGTVVDNEIKYESGLPKGEELTALMDTVTGLYVKARNLSQNQSITLQFIVKTDGNKASDEYKNFATCWIAGSDGIPLTSNMVETAVISRSISGVVWHDKNLDGLRGKANDGTDEPLLSGVTATLFKKNKQGTYELCTKNVTDETISGTCVTGADGAYTFEKLAEGDYIVAFSGGELNKFTGTTTYQTGGPSAVSNDGVAASELAAIGIEASQYNDYRVLASNLLSTNNYAFDLAAIPLMQGEVVTDIRLEFGKVPAGFASVVKPTVTIQTKGTLANGYQVVNRADAGGQYMSQWETGRTAWITLIINLNPPTLPKTGY